MPREFRMPSLGADMEAGTLVQWKVQPGMPVHRGDVVALVETEKGIIDIESFDEGVVERLTVEPGARVPVGTVLALFEGEPEAQAAAAVPAPAPKPAAEQVMKPVEAPHVAPVARREIRVSPAARVKAVALSVDLAKVQGTGEGGVITLQDVLRVAASERVSPAEQPAPEGAPTARVPPPAAPAREGMRKAIAASMSRSKREIPHYYLQLAVDFQPAQRWLEDYNAKRPVPERVLPAVLLIKATALAAQAVPGFNGVFEAGQYAQAAAVNLGVAIALRGGGLAAPAILDAASKPLAQIMRDLQDLVGRVRTGHMRSAEIGLATLTLTSLGDEAAEVVYPIIYPPQVAIVGFGAVLERPWVVEGRVEVRPVVMVTLAADHRVTDGRKGAQFLARIRDGLMKPGEL